MEESDLIAFIAEGNIYAFEQLYKDTYKKVFAFILSMTKCRQTAEDLMHDTYIRVFEKARSYQIGTNVKTWIMTIARNITYDFFRRTKNTIPIEESFMEDSAAISCDDSMSMVDNIDLEDALKKLPIPNAQIVVLYAVCGYKHREIAEILSIPEGTVRRRYKEALRQLAVEMGGVRNE
jgi:RNA polymerase sigma-70 factor (ECF subfamily)